jgi:rhodanese-related sulfurtransferase
MDLSQQDWTIKLAEDQNAIVLDVRTLNECNEGMIPSAINVDIYKGQDFIDELETLDKTKNYYVYCRSGGRSAQACAIMNQLGFETTHNLLGGFTQWKGEVTFPVED